MRLKHIKLAGFKSFVDPTVVEVNTNLTAIVGPNGCGKSNIIDAVRWVMGESSAKNLRGDSMDDVIFNGSNTRQPLAQASIELLFDNSDATIGGEFAGFAEIAVRRQVTRDGNSSYFINNAKCRKRDMTQLFLGTGLGPRSYSVIEQGTISRLIEAKPEEFRAFLEEAAGISKYKERRRETENRIRHTNENLDRLTDLREELGKQLEKLKRQARSAERYRELKEQETTLHAQVLALRWHSVNKQFEELELSLHEAENKLQEQIAGQRHIEAQIEESREQHHDYNEAFNEVQAKYYGKGAEIERFEQEIKYKQQRKEHLSTDKAESDNNLFELQRVLQSDQEQSQDLQKILDELSPLLEESKQVAEESVEHLQEAEESMRQWQSDWDSNNSESAKLTQAAEVQQTRIQHCETTLLQLQDRFKKIEEELAEINPQEVQDKLDEAQEMFFNAESEKENIQQQLATCNEQIQEQRSNNKSMQQRLELMQGDLHSKQGKHASLEALQQAALGKRQDSVVQWLQHNQLDDKPRLAQMMQVEAGWERAIEVVLGSSLEALCVDGFDSVSGVIESLQHGHVCFIDTSSNVSVNNFIEAQTLASMVNSNVNLSSVLSGIYIADDLSHAMQLRNQLGANESVVTRDGIWLGKSWIRVVKDDDERAGVLQREQELESLQREIADLKISIEGIEEEILNGQAQLEQAEASRETYQQQANESTRKVAEVQAQARMLTDKLERSTRRQQQLNEESAENNTQQETINTDYHEARTQWQQALQDTEGYANKREQLMLVRDELRQRLDNTRQQSREAQAKSHEYEVKIETAKTQINSKEEHSSRAQQQILDLQVKQQQLHAELLDLDTPLQELNAQLEESLSSRLGIESDLNEAKQRLSHVEHQLREFERQRHEAESSVQDKRDRLEQQRIDRQGLDVRRNTIVEQLNEEGQEIDVIMQGMPKEANESEWSAELQNVEEKIKRLGAINLAAIEEADAVAERKVYLDQQHEDLIEALTTLENAIAKIDKETKTKFKETFDNVNESFQNLFPQLFGGGKAYLELTGDDLLDSGVTVFAQPPGKRNSTIHLLSGGEKALTAVSLVFSIFRLNPAPFCLLDEVDAPLDDANVGRFCNIVKEMSKDVQFLFISHNKITIAMGDQLAGVTMQEPGVSRLVSVDMEEAVAMAEA